MVQGSQVCAGVAVLLGMASLADVHMLATAGHGSCGTPRYSAEMGLWQLGILAIPVSIGWLVSGFKNPQLLGRRVLMLSGLTCWAFGFVSACIH